jgi:hypothetical protein
MRNGWMPATRAPDLDLHREPARVMLFIAVFWKRHESVAAVPHPAGWIIRSRLFVSCPRISIR